MRLYAETRASPGASGNAGALAKTGMYVYNMLMKYRFTLSLFILLALLSAVLGGCALNPTVRASVAVQETPEPCIAVANTPIRTAEPIVEPTATPKVYKPIEFGDDVRGITVSEVMISGKAVHVHGQAAGFIELRNSGTEPVSLEGFCLSDHFNDPERYPLPAITLEPGEHYAFVLKGEGASEPYELPFLLSESDDGLQLFYAPERQAVRYTFSELPEKDVSVSPQPDGSMLWCAYATPGKKNAATYKTAEARQKGLLSHVYFSEISAEGAGWIELSNGARSSVSLRGWTWTDDPDEPKKESLSGRIEAGAQAVFRPSSLRLSRSGETLYLYDADGFLRDRFKTGVLEAALYQEAPFTLSISCADPNAVIYYTTDGNAPTEQSQRYSGPIEISTSTAVRALAVSPGKKASQETAVHFIFGVTHTLPVVYIDMDPARFKRLKSVPFDEGGLKEQPCYVAFYESDGRYGTSFPAGVKPRGNASISYAQKSMSLHLRTEYGQKSVRYDFWNTGVTGPYVALVLRNSGQDTNGCHLRDAFAQRASKNLRMDTQNTRPVVVYVNGEYYGVLDLNENMNKATFALRYGVDEDQVNIVQRNDYVNTGSADGFVALRRYAMTKNFSDDDVVAKFAEDLDIDAVTDYIIAQSFFGNYDIHNQNYWSSADGSVTWRPFLYDVDRCLNAESMRSNVLSMYFNPDGIVHNRKGDRIMMDMYCALKKNPAWRDAFLRRYAYLLCNDYSAETLLALFDEMVEEIRPEMERHTEKFGTPTSLESWEKNVTAMRQNIIDRYDVIVKNICSVFRITPEQWEEIIAPYRAGAPWEG